MNFRDSPRGAELSTLTLSYVVDKVIGESPGSGPELIIQSSLADLDRMLEEIAQAIRDAKSPPGLRLRRDLREAMSWLLHAQHIREVKNGLGESVYYRY